MCIASSGATLSWVVGPQLANRNIVAAVPNRAQTTSRVPSFGNMAGHY